MYSKRDLYNHSTVVDGGSGDGDGDGAGLDRLGSGNLASVDAVLGLLGGEGKAAEGPEISRIDYTVKRGSSQSISLNCLICSLLT